MVGVGLLSAGAMALLYTIGVKDSNLYYATPTRLSGLLLGSALAFWWTPRRVRGTTGKHARVVLDLAGVVGLYLLWWSFRGTHDYDAIAFRGGFLIVDVATLLVIAAVVHPRGDMNKILGIPLLVWIGLRSYGIYLWHFPIFAVTRTADLEDTFGFTPPGWLWFAIRLGLTLGIAALSYKYVEVPIRSGAIKRYMEQLRAARGPGKRRLATRGVAVAGLISLLAIGLTTGLASAAARGREDPRHREPGRRGEARPRRRAPGSDRRAQGDAQRDDEHVDHADDDGAGRRSERDDGSDARTDHRATAAGRHRRRVLGMGDSVMLGARGVVASRRSRAWSSTRS